MKGITNERKGRKKRRQIKTFIGETIEMAGYEAYSHMNWVDDDYRYKKTQPLIKEKKKTFTRIKTKKKRIYL